MRITFSIHYRTSWGESLCIAGGVPVLGDGDETQAATMRPAAPGVWQLTVELPDDTPAFDYHYVVKAPGRPWRSEWGSPHRFVPGVGVSTYRRYDAWHDMPADKPHYSSAFVDGILARRYRDQPLKPVPGSIRLRVSDPMVAPGQILAVAGSLPSLGSWNPAQAVRLNDSRFPVWEVNLPAADLSAPFEFKFVVLDRDTMRPVRWETIDNRVYDLPLPERGAVTAIDCGEFAGGNIDWRGAGTAIPVFSIRTGSDFGVGDFLDIKAMVDWCAHTGQKVLQLLPVNDTTMTHTWVDSYPYKANSTFALHPMYLRPEAAGMLRDKKRREYFAELAAELNKLDTVDYERVNAAKHEYMRELYSEQAAAVRDTKEYKSFVAANDYWLRPYAVWCALRDKTGTPDHTRWQEFSTVGGDTLERVCRMCPDDVGYWYFVQYHLDRQLRQARDYAHLSGVVLKGDIPIGISRTSVDAWLYPRLFNMDCQAGAPPDAFSTLGQNWGFPTYNWDEMARDGFAWWRSRFEKMSEYFDAYRIDHILGFFRIWQIPLDAEHGLLGYFNPALPFAADELARDYGFHINPDVHTRPLILEWMLRDFFGDAADEARDRFMEHVGGDRWRLRPYVDTQLKVAEYFATQPDTEANRHMRDALLGIIDDVLFIEDPYQRGHYHPRIAAQYTYQYRVLADHDKDSFNRLYNDFFYRRHNEFWRGKAMWKLPPLLDATRMLACAEDLGMIPDCVPPVMEALRILSLEIQRMPKDPEREFGDTWHYPYLSVCTTSTHDMPGIREWWESDHDMAQRYYNNVLCMHGDAPYFCEPWVCDRIVDLQLESPSMLCILPLQDWLSTDGVLRRKDPREEQINVPANPRHYWRYRMHLTVERLMASEAFNDDLSARIARSGR